MNRYYFAMSFWICRRISSSGNTKKRSFTPFWMTSHTLMQYSKEVLKSANDISIIIDGKLMKRDIYYMSCMGDNNPIPLGILLYQNSF